MLGPKLNNLLFSTVIESGSARLFWAIAVFFVSVSVASMLLGAVKNLLMARVDTKLSLSVEAATMMRVLSLPAGFFKDYSAGELSGRAQQISALCGALVNAVLSTGQEVTYAGRAYLSGAFNIEDKDGNQGSQGDDKPATDQDDSQGSQSNNKLVADQDGVIYVDRIDSGAVVSLRSIAPEGYITEWVNGTLDFDEDGVIDNKNAGGMSQSEVDSLYIPVYGDQFIYQVNQVNPKYYYRFTKFAPSRLLNGKTRVGYVMYDQRNILDYDGKEAQYHDLAPLAGATVVIGGNTAVTDEIQGATRFPWTVCRMR